VRDARFFHVGQGLIAPNTYWQVQQNIRSYMCGKGVQNIRFNAGTLIGYQSRGDDEGLIIDGENWTVSGFHTQNTQKEAWVKTGRGAVFKSSYFEDVASGGGASDYMLKVGMTAGDVLTTLTRFTGLRFGGSVTKKAIQMLGAYGVELENCEKANASSTLDIDPSCLLSARRCNFATGPISPIYTEGLVNVTGITLPTIAAHGVDYSTVITVPGVRAGDHISVTKTSGFDTYLLVDARATADNTVGLYITNPLTVSYTGSGGHAVRVRWAREAP
jgi:hypothetical protein